MPRSLRPVTAVLATLVATLVAVLAVLVLGANANATAKPVRGPGLEKERQLVLRAVDRVDVAVTRAVDDRRLRGLDAEMQDALRANADLDHDVLALLVDAASAATTRTELRTVSLELRAVRPHLYATAVAALRVTARMATQVADIRELRAEDLDAGVVLDEADALVQAAAYLALGVTATSDRAALAELRAALSAAHEAVEALEELVEG